MNEQGEWKSVIERVVPAIVALHVISPRAFDTETPGASQATGFVIDAKVDY